MAALPRGQMHSSRMRIAQLSPACFALDSFRRKTWSDDPGNKMAFLPHRPQPRHLDRDELKRICMRAMRQGGHLGIEPPSRRATRNYHFELEKATVKWLVSRSVLRLLANSSAQRSFKWSIPMLCTKKNKKSYFERGLMDFNRTLSWYLYEFCVV